MRIEHQVVSHNIGFVRAFAVGRFPVEKVPRKIKRAYFAEEIKTAVVSGQLAMNEEILRRYGKGEFNDLDDLIASIHLISVEIMNDFVDTAAQDKTKRYSVEDFLPGGSMLQERTNEMH